MVRIRLRRVGSKNQPSYRIVAADREAPRDGRFLEVLGHYNPRTEPSTVVVDEARLFHWMSNGAQPSDAVTQALRALGTWDRWDRFKNGEAIEKLVAEAEKALPEVDPRTRRDDLFGKSKKKSKKSEEVKTAAKAEVKADEAPVAESADEPVADAEVEDPAAEAAVEASDEVEAEPQAEAQAEAEPETEAVAEVETELEAVAEAETEPEAEPDVEPEQAEEVEAEDSD